MTEDEVRDQTIALLHKLECMHSRMIDATMTLSDEIELMFKYRHQLANLLDWTRTHQRRRQKRLIVRILEPNSKVSGPMRKVTKDEIERFLAQ